MAVTLGLLSAAAVGAVFVVTTAVVTRQSRERAGVEIDVARAAFASTLTARASAARAAADLVTQLPVFRAHLTDARLAADEATVAEMADGYRAQLEAQFAIVTRGDAAWTAHPGWTGAPAAAASPLGTAIASALQGRAETRLVDRAGVLYLTTTVPARFADEVLGTLTFGYAITDAVAAELAHLARAEALIVVGDRLVASSLGHRDDAPPPAIASAPSAADGVVPGLQAMDDRRYVAGRYPLAQAGLAGDDGTLVLLSDWQPTQEFLDVLRWRFALTGVVVLIVAVAAGVLFSRRVSRPLRLVAEAASEVASGNLALSLPEQGPDESVRVARAFNDMNSSLRAAQARLTHDATHDPLTGLPNRILFMERLDRALIRRQRHPGYLFAVLFVDLDRFKHVNDSLGHAAGDDLLVRVAQRLSGAVRRDDIVMRAPEPDATVADASTLARFGGDEFVVLLDDLRDPIDAVRVAERIQRLSRLPFAIGAQDVFATPSIGIVVSDASHTSAQALVRDADLAMFRAKQAGGNAYALSDGEMHAKAVHRLKLETDLRRAIERHEFVVYYQPIVTLRDRTVEGYEALVRWQHPDRGLIAPGEFLAVADDVGLTPQLDELVLREACRQGRDWLDASPDVALSMSVNLSAKAFAQTDVVALVEQVLATTGFPATRLRIEITESTAIVDPARATAVMRALRALGVRVSIDDFGTGYCSLSYLQMFPVDALKIDRSFVSGLPGTGQREIVELVVSLAQTLGLDVVAEGTERDDQVGFLQRLGCRYAQGFCFSRPLPPDRVARPGTTLALSAVRD
ncbi:MAG: EAL domain-containing protein [Vicinamibacterales bacterium]